MLTPTSNSCWMSIKEGCPVAIKKAEKFGREARWLVGDAYLWMCVIFQKAFIRPERRIEITSTSFTYQKIEMDTKKED